MTNLGLMQRQTRDPLARRSLERSLAIREGLAREHPTSSDFQIELAKSTLFLAAVQAAAGQTDEALVNIKKAEHIAEQFPEVNKANILYNLACAYAQCGAGAGHAKGGLSAAEREAYADRAMAVMGQAIKAGFADRAILRRDIDLDSLRPRGDFQELMMDQSFPADPFQH